MHDNTPNDPETTTPGQHRHRWGHAILTLALAAGLIATGIHMFGPDAAASYFGRQHRCHHDPGRRPDAHAIRGHIRATATRMLERIDANDEQRQQVLAIIDSSVEDLVEFHHGRAELRDEVVAVLTAPSVDRPALEQLRRRKLADFEQTSARILDAIGEISEILNQEQRRQIAEHLRRHRG